MNLVKTAAGKTELKITRAEWQAIGKQAGWFGSKPEPQAPSAGQEPFYGCPDCSKNGETPNPRCQTCSGSGKLLVKDYPAYRAKQKEQQQQQQIAAQQEAQRQKKQQSDFDREYASKNVDVVGGEFVHNR